jgi:hypothetical protein
MRTLKHEPFVEGCDAVFPYSGSLFKHITVSIRVVVHTSAKLWTCRDILA